jgi:hypothetical protein
MVDGGATKAVAYFLQALDPVVTAPKTVVAEGIKIYHNLNLTSDISLNYLVAKSALEGYENILIECKIPVYVDGVLLEEDYVFSPTNREEGIEFPLTVGEGQIFVMGDNRERSTDSRSPQIGLVDKRQIVGKAIFIISPGDNGGKESPKWNRVGWIG